MQSPVVQSAVPVAVAKCGNVKKRKKVFTVLLAAVFVLMGGSILTLIALMAGIRGISFVWNFIPFGCFAVAAVSMPVVMFQKNKYANLAALAERIESKDATVIASLSPEICIHRVTGDGPASLLIAPLWSKNKRDVLNGITVRMKEKGIRQGSYYEPSGTADSL